jgi:hypothetical protein
MKDTIKFFKLRATEFIGVHRDGQAGQELVHWHSRYENCICAIILNALGMKLDGNFNTPQIKKGNRAKLADSRTIESFLTYHNILLRNS